MGVPGLALRHTYRRDNLPRCLPDGRSAGGHQTRGRHVDQPIAHVTGGDGWRATLDVAPALSPDGRWLASLTSQRFAFTTIRRGKAGRCGDQVAPRLSGMPRSPRNAPATCRHGARSTAPMCTTRGASSFVTRHSDGAPKCAWSLRTSRQPAPSAGSWPRRPATTPNVTFARRCDVSRSYPKRERGCCRPKRTIKTGTSADDPSREGQCSTGSAAVRVHQWSPNSDNCRPTAASCQSPWARTVCPDRLAPPPAP